MYFRFHCYRGSLFIYNYLIRYYIAKFNSVLSVEHHIRMANQLKVFKIVLTQIVLKYGANIDLKLFKTQFMNGK